MLTSFQNASAEAGDYKVVSRSLEWDILHLYEEQKADTLVLADRVPLEAAWADCLY
jgi:hypothetical protein